MDGIHVGKDGKARGETVGRAIDSIVGDGLRVIRDKHGNEAVDPAGKREGIWQNKPF